MAIVVALAVTPFPAQDTSPHEADRFALPPTDEGLAGEGPIRRRPAENIGA